MSSDADPQLVPARMLNEYVYCPRLAYLEWVQGEFEDNADTVEGRYVHRRVDRETGMLPEPTSEGDCDPKTFTVRSVMLSAPKAGLIARIDLLEGEAEQVVPVEYKRGSPPKRPQRAWDPERVQLCAQGLILRENGFQCDHGVLYFAETKTRVEVCFDDDLVKLTVDSIGAIRDMAEVGAIPPPLLDSPKCGRCSLVGICLPDEVRHLGAGETLDDVRRLYPARDDALPVYVRQNGGFIGKRGETLCISSRDKKQLDRVRLLDVAQLSIFGNVTISAAALRELCNRGIPTCHFTYGGWFTGITHGQSSRNIELRQSQFRAADDPEKSGELARSFVATKIRNCRTLLMRNSPDLPGAVRKELKRLGERATRTKMPDKLLGIEGAAARVYFAHLSGMLKPPTPSDLNGFDFEGRNRRPPRDPVNALLSFAYSMLTKELTIATMAVGFDPYLGFFHTPHHGRPSLALDLMEEFRPIIADSVVISAINNAEVRTGDFVMRGHAAALKDRGRRRFIEAFERRLDSLITHPVFGYRISYRRVLAVQARLLGRYLMGEIPHYPPFRTR